MRYLEYVLTNAETGEKIITKDYEKAATLRDADWEMETWIKPCDGNLIDKAQKL